MRIGILSIAISTIIIVILAEIIPQAFFKKHALKVGAMFARPVRVLIVMLIIPTYFIALALDFLCGHDEGLTYNVTGKFYYFAGEEKVYHVFI